MARPKTRTVVIVVGALLGLVLVVGGGAATWILTRHLPSLPPAPRDPVPPDLVTSISEPLVGRSSDGSTTLRFTTTIANVGEGALTIRADRRTRWSSDWRVSQILEERDGQTSARPVPGTMVWGGHGHDHWHLRFGAAYAFEPISGGKTRRAAKVGYCFYDQVALRGVATSAQFPKTTCDGRDRTSVEMGLTVGWSDPYQWTLQDQSIDVTGYPDGVYRLTARADPDGWLLESDETNNAGWIELRLISSASPPRITVLRSSDAPG